MDGAELVVAPPRGRPVVVKLPRSRGDDVVELYAENGRLAMLSDCSNVMLVKVVDL